MSEKKYVVLAEEFSHDPHYGKTLRGVMRYRRESVVAIVDSNRAGETDDGLPLYELTPAGTEALSDVACSAHFLDGDGLVRLSVCEEDPQADATRAATITVANAVNE